MKKILCTSLAVVMVLALLAGCGNTGGGGGGGSDEKVLKIGVLEPLTGENGGGGLQELDGIRYARSLRPTVTVGGEEYTIQLVERDNKTDRTESVTAAQSIVSENVACALGTFGSATAIAAAPVFEEAQIPILGASCTNPQVTIGNEYYFRICFLDPFQGTVMANYAWQQGYTKVAVITQLGDDYSAGLGDFFAKAFVDLGGEIVSNEVFQTGATDFKAILTNVKAADPEFIFAPSSSTTAPMIIMQARELGITVGIGGGDTWDNSTIYANAGADADGVVYSTFFAEGDDSPLAAAFVSGFKDYLASDGQSDSLSAFSALGFDVYNMMLDAIEDADSIESADIHAALKALQTEGVTGKVSFDDNGDAIKDMAFIMVVQDSVANFLKTVTIAEIS